MTNGRDRYRSRENRRLVRELFMRDWDPIEEYMGLTATTRSVERCRRVAEALIALKPSLVPIH